jgi:hypothetical protein
MPGFDLRRIVRFTSKPLDCPTARSRAMNGPDETTTTTRAVKRACRADGCTCEDGRIVSPRRAAFFATLARANGQTANRRIAAEDGWRLPQDPAAA